MADLLQTLLAALEPPSATGPSFLGAEVPSEDLAMPSAPGRFGIGQGMGRTQPPAGMPGIVVAPPDETAAAGNPLLKSLAEAFGPKPMAPPAAPSAPPPTAPSPQVPSRPSVGGPAPGSSSGITGDDVVRFIRNVSQGAAGVDPRRPGVSAFMQGAGGTLTAKQQEQEREKLLAQQRADKAFDQTLKVRADSRAETKEGREGKSATYLDRLREARAKSAEQSPTGKTSVFEVKRQAWLDVNPGDSQGALDYASGRRTMSEPEINKAALAAAQKDAREGSLPASKVRERAEEYSRALKSGFTNQGTGSKSGDGKTREAPARPASQQDFDTLPKDAWFVNPSDGRLLQKK